jgi:C1A family cysteine protease
MTWQADECLLQHAQCEAESSLVMIADEKNGGAKKVDATDEKFKAAWAKLHEYQKLYADADSIPEDKIPSAFDLRNFTGYDFTSGVKDQGGCGSCYTFSFLQALESRLLQQEGKAVEPLSPQQVISCNYMTEGCEGGWAALNGFFAENSNLVGEACAPYQFTTKNWSCMNYAECPGVARVKRTYKLQNPTEQSIQRELLRNGMVVTDWCTPTYFKTYKQGLFQIAPGDDIHYEYKAGLPNHASVIVGWGSQKNEHLEEQPYWIVRNSFGTSFGMDGDMYIPRGSNAF